MNRFENWLGDHGDPTAVWLDYHEYAGRLLGDGGAPWLDTAALVSWYRQSQGLLNSGVIAVPVEPVMRAWAAAHEELVRAMGEKQRLLYAVKTLLADDALGSHLSEVLTGLRATLAAAPIALVLPAPERLIRLGREIATGQDDAGDIDEDDVDSAAVYVADFLRRFSTCDIDIVLLQEGVGQEITEEAVDLYRPIANIAGHYEWMLGLHLGHAPTWKVADSVLSFVIAPTAVPDAPCGIELDAGFWSAGAGSEPDRTGAGFVYARIPADAVPETVLERLSALR